MKQFARERSHQDVKAANDFGRAAAQAAIIINGGAATAVFAYSAKIEEITSSLIRVVPYSLAGYALGVLFGALMLFFMKLELDYYGLYWSESALTEKDDRKIFAGRKAWLHQRLSILSFGLSMLFFVTSTFAIAVSLLKALQ